MVGHTFEYHGAVRKIKEIVKSGELGKVFYVDSSRVNLGLFQGDINVLWDLAPMMYPYFFIFWGKNHML
jgi:predicted dehydrogenase